MEAFTTGRPAVMHDAYAGVVANLLGTAAKAQLRGALAEQFQVALDSRGLIERAKGR